MRQGDGKSVTNRPAAYSKGAENPAEEGDAGLRPPLLLKTRLRYSEGFARTCCALAAESRGHGAPRQLTLKFHSEWVAIYERVYHRPYLNL